MAEGAPVERLMLFPDRDQEMVGAEIFGGKPAQPQRDIGQPGVIRESVLLVTKRVGSTITLPARVQARADQRTLSARKLGVLLRGDMNPNRARKFAVEVKPEDASIVHLVVRVREDLRWVGFDRASVQVGA